MPPLQLFAGSNRHFPKVFPPAENTIMVHYEGGVQMELRYFLGGVGDRAKKPRGFLKENPSVELKNNMHLRYHRNAVNFTPFSVLTIL